MASTKRNTLCLYELSFIESFNEIALNIRYDESRMAIAASY